MLCIRGGRFREHPVGSSAVLGNLCKRSKTRIGAGVTLPAVTWRLAVASWIFCVALSYVAPADAQQKQYTADEIQAGARIYVAQCQTCHGPNGNNIAGVDLARQQFPHAVSDDDIRKVIMTGNPQGMPPFAFEPGEVDDLVAYVRSGLDQGGVNFRLGDAARGEAIYDKEGCAACHRIDGKGSRIAPDLSAVGLKRRPGQIQTSLTDPNKVTMPINRPITIVTKNGHTIHGRRFNEDTESVQLMDEQGNMLSIQKADMRQYDISRTSDMPSYKERLNDDELADLLAYLVSLKRH